MNTNRPIEVTIDELTDAAMLRLPEFKNHHGKSAHSEPDGSDWSPAQWLQAVMGELGEYANARKKFERGDLALEEFKVMAEQELADVMCYLVILARRCLDIGGEAHPTGINLNRAVIRKFNEVSRRVGSNIYLPTARKA